MTTTNGLSDHVSAANRSAAPRPPTLDEAKFYYYGLPSQPRLVARSSTFIYVKPTGPEAYHKPKEISPFTSSHPLRAIWEVTVGPAIVEYLNTAGANWTSLDPVRIGFIGGSSPLPIIWLGVVPDSLSATEGVEVATHCKGILSAHDIDDVHVEIRESEVVRSASRGPKLYKPAPASSPIATAGEAFSTSLGLPICAGETPYVEGTGGFFVSDPRRPCKLYLVTARHVLFPPEDNTANELYRHSDCDASGPRRNVLLFSDAALEKHIEGIRSEIRGKESVIDWLERRLVAAEELDEEDAEMERADAQRELNTAQEALEALQTLLADVSRDWTSREDRVLGHVVLSPSLSVDPESGFVEDWAVVEIDGAKIDTTNFVGNAIDLATTDPIDFTAWMCPQQEQPGQFAGPLPGSFRYPRNRLLKFCGTVPDEEVWKPIPQNPDHHDDPQCIMVIKRGSASGLTVGRLNTLRSFTRIFVPAHSHGQPESNLNNGDWQTSKAVAVLPRSSKWPRENPFAQPGDSGAAVVDGGVRLVGLLVGGAGKPGEDAFDCTYLTSIDFIRERMAEYGLEADLSPSLARGV